MGLKVSIIEESCELDSQQGTAVVNRASYLLFRTENYKNPPKKRSLCI